MTTTSGPGALGVSNLRRITTPTPTRGSSGYSLLMLGSGLLPGAAVSACLACNFLAIQLRGSRASGLCTNIWLRNNIELWPGSPPAKIASAGPNSKSK